MSGRKGELSASGIDRDWPNRLALSVVTLSTGCIAFAELARANLFRARFNDKRFNTDRGHGTAWIVWRDQSKR